MVQSEPAGGCQPSDTLPDCPPLPTNDTAQPSGAVSLGSDGWPSDRQEFPAAVRESRKAASLSQVELAEKVDISEVTIRNIETGRTKPAAPHRQWAKIRRCQKAPESRVFIRKVKSSVLWSFAQNANRSGQDPRRSGRNSRASSTDVSRASHPHGRRSAGRVPGAAAPRGLSAQHAARYS